jgi:DNA gyrase subunit A
MITKNGIIKKTPLAEFQNVRKNGIIAISLAKEDSLLSVKLSSGEDDVILTTFNGQSIHFKEKDIRSMGRNASGIKAIRLKTNDKITGADIFNPKLTENLKLLVVSEKGFGKQTNLKEYKTQKRGGSGIKAAKVTSKTGGIMGAYIINPEMENIVAFTSRGQVIKISLKEIRVLSRSTQGVKIMNIASGDKLVGAVCF